MRPRVCLTVAPEDDGAEVLALLRGRLGISTALLRRLKTTPGGILLDGEPVRVRVRARAGQVLSILPEPDGERRVKPERGPLDMVYEDGDLLVLCKPSGLPVHPGPGHEGGTLANYVAAHLGEESAFHAVNRLDGGTSGLMCVARHKLAAARLAAQVADGRLCRAYRAVCDGVGLPPAGMIDAPIGRLPGSGIRRCVTPEGQRAVTRFARVGEGSGRTLLALALETGRTHQIRVHLAHLGHPVAGDFLYGVELPWLTGFALHSCALALVQPTTGETLRFESPDPPSFARLLAGEDGRTS